MGSRGRLNAVVVAGILGAAVAAPANAAILTVTTTQDNLTSGDHQCSLREAIAAVNTPGSASDCGLADDVSNTIVLGPQPYNLTIHPDVSDGQLTGDLDVSGTTPLTIAGAGVSATSLNGALLQDRIMHVIPGRRSRSRTSR